MRPESESIGKEDTGGRDKSTPTVLTWKMVEIPDREESKKQITEEYFGDILVKIKQLIIKEKREFDKVMKEKKHGH